MLRGSSQIPQRCSLRRPEPAHICSDRASARRERLEARLGVGRSRRALVLGERDARAVEAGERHAGGEERAAGRLAAGDAGGGAVGRDDRRQRPARVADAIDDGAWLGLGLGLGLADPNPYPNANPNPNPNRGRRRRAGRW